ncbi:uncharacterized protein B0T15DRAFT_497996 [Chaetomium strumarium]|uniref:Uncharacterized protein n=1 Tax=Chaetomium strumarium TaxID=1170767 RepID=A0AAJ0M5E5_9PEZI|nr:hypothetical protein B0T15DRAFT_497996 [Chaetomium strumarium]
MPALPTERQAQTAGTQHRSRLQTRFPGFQVRPARPSDFRAMARMATATFRDEHEVSHFTRYRRALDPAAVARANRLALAEFAWRLATMHATRRLPGRHFLVATYLRTPVEYLSTLRGAHETREEILAWAEWQEPVCALASVGPRRESLFPPDDSPFAGLGKSRGEQVDVPRSAHAKLEAILQGMQSRCGEYTVLVPPNSGAVYRQVAVEGFHRARLDFPEEWRRWSQEFLPAFLGPDGDAQGRYMALRALVVNTNHWGNGIEHELLDWGVQKARDRSWDILTVVPSVMNSWTLDCLLDTGFKEVGSLEIFWGSQHALMWDHSSTGCGYGQQKQQQDKDKMDDLLPAASSEAVISVRTGEEAVDKSVAKSTQAGASRLTGTRLRHARG